MQKVRGHSSLIIDHGSLVVCKEEKKEKGKSWADAALRPSGIRRHVLR